MTCVFCEKNRCHIIKKDMEFDWFILTDVEMYQCGACRGEWMSADQVDVLDRRYLNSKLRIQQNRGKPYSFNRKVYDRLLQHHV